MLHHISLPVSNLEASSLFYDALLGSLEFQRAWSAEDAIGYGLEKGNDFFAIKQTSPAVPAGSGFHVAFAAKSRAHVAAFYDAGMEYGALDNGGPGLRVHYGPSYFAAFIVDLDGHRLEAVYNEPSKA